MVRIEVYRSISRPQPMPSLSMFWQVKQLVRMGALCSLCCALRLDAAEVKGWFRKGEDGFWGCWECPLFHPGDAAERCINQSLHVSRMEETVHEPGRVQKLSLLP